MKNRKIRLFLISAVILAFLFNAGVFAESSEILIPEMPYHHFQLDNGLQVFVFEDHRIPLVELSIFYKVGSIDEEKGLSGIAHFLELSPYNGVKMVF